MSTLAHPPVPHRRLHLPSRRHMSQIGFLLGAAAGGVSYVVRADVAVALFVFALAWYALSYAVVRVAEHAANRTAWIVHVVLLPAVAIAAAVVAGDAWPGQTFGAVFVGLVGGVAVQAAVTHAVLRGVVSDQRHDLRHRLGLE